MQNVIKIIKSSVVIGISFLMAVFICGLVAYAVGWSTTSPTTITNDSSLYVSSGNTLSVSKRNEVVNKINDKKSLDSSKILTCIYSITNAGTAGQWKTRTWIASDCGGVNTPSDYSTCFSAIKRKDGGGVQKGLARCNQPDGWIYLDIANSQVSLECSYMCWN